MTQIVIFGETEGEWVTGAVNGRVFRLPTDQIVDVTDEVLEALEDSDTVFALYDGDTIGLVPPVGFTTAESMAASATSTLSAIYADAQRAGLFTVADVVDYAEFIEADPAQIAFIQSTRNADKVWKRASFPTIRLRETGAKASDEDVQEKLRQAAWLIEQAGGGTIVVDDFYNLGVSLQDNGLIMSVLLGPNTRIVEERPGCGFRVVDDAGNYTGLFGSRSTSSTKIRMEGLLIDQNPDGNTTCDVTPGVTDGALMTCYFIGSDTRIEGMEVQGACGVNTWSINGPHLVDAELIDCKAFFKRANSSLAVYDNSAGYINARYAKMIGCEARNIGDYGEAVSAWEMHGANTVVRGCKGDGYQCLINIVGENAPAAGNGNRPILDRTCATVEDNEGVNMRTGILGWSLTGTTFRGLRISRNKIWRNPDLFPDSPSAHTGVGLVYSPSISGDFDDVYSHDNEDVCELFVDAASASGSAGFQWEAQGNITLTSINDRSIGAPCIGHSVYSHGGVATVDIQRPYSEDAGRNTSAPIRVHGILRGVVKGSVIGAEVVDTGSSSTLAGTSSGWLLNNLLAGSDVIFQPKQGRFANSGGQMTANRSGTYDKHHNILTLAEAASIPIPVRGGARDFLINMTSSSARTINTDSGGIDPVNIGEEITITVQAGAVTTNITWGTGFIVAGWTNPTANQRSTARFRWNGTKWDQITPFLVRG